MAKISRFQRSQRAHSSLRNKYAHNRSIKGVVKHAYHKEVLARQKAYGRVLTPNEKKIVYNLVTPSRFK